MCILLSKGNAQAITKFLLASTKQIRQFPAIVNFHDNKNTVSDVI